MTAGGKRGFGSDNHCGVHPELMHAVVLANTDHVAAYQTDPASRACAEVWRAHFGDVSVFYVFNGSAANVLALRAVTPGFGAVLCSDVAHLHQDAGGSPEFMLGCKIQPVPSIDGKLVPDALLPFFDRPGDQHVAQPKALSLTQPTELGTVYTLEELRALCDFAHARGLSVHMDGARLMHAATWLNCSLGAMTRDVGVDALSFGGTKNGLLGGEAVVLFQGDISARRFCHSAQDVKFLRKQLMQLPSKTRFIAVQFEALLSGVLWREMSCHAVGLARQLAQMLAPIDAVEVVYAVEANMVFVQMPKTWVKPLRRTVFFYVWQKAPCIARFVISFDNTRDDIEQLVSLMQGLAQEAG